MTKHRPSATLYLAPWYRRSPYFESTQRNGCLGYDIYNHTYTPSDYGLDAIDEYWHLLNNVVLWDVGAERQLEIAGPDAFAFTNLLTCRDLSKCQVGQCKYVLLTDQDGGLINDPVLLRLGENHFWLSLADSDALLWAKGVAVNSGMDVQIRESDASPVQVQGPKSRNVMQALLGDSILSLRYYFCTEGRIGDIPVVVSRTGWTGELGYEIYLRDATRGDELWQKVMDAGLEDNIKTTAPVEARRIEAGIFNYGSDMSLENNPFELSGLERLVELDQEADFIGKEALTRIKREGISQKLVGIVIEGEPLPAESAEYWEVFYEGVRVGHVTDAIWSPRLSRNIGYVWVPIELANPGTQLHVKTSEGRPFNAHTASLPFVDPNKKIPAT